MNVRYKFTPCHRHNNTGTQTHTHAAMVVWVWFSPLLFVCSSIMFSLSNVFVLRIIVTFLLLLCSACTFTLALLRSHARPKARNTTKHKSICSINFYMTWEHFSPMAFVTTIHCHVHHDINVNVTMARSIFPAKWKCSLFTCERMFGFFYCNCCCCCCWCYGCFLSHKYVLPHMKFHVILLSRWEWEREGQKEQTSVRVLWNLCWSGCYL